VPCWLVHSVTRIAADSEFKQFVVDGTWITDHTAPQESDDSNNVNNVLLPDTIPGPHSSSSPVAAGTMSGVTPHSTTVGLASNVPKESKRAEQEVRLGSASSDLPGSFPETPFHDANEFTVDPIPGTSGTGNPANLQPGDKVPHHSNFAENTINSNVKTDKESYEKVGRADESEQTFGVAPIPATSGAGNPISLQPGDKVPHHREFTSNTIGSNVTTDKESYEKVGGADISAPYKAGEMSRDMSRMPPVSGTMIPESSLPMGEGAGATDPGYMMQSAGANSTTAALAAQVPLEPRGVPTVVSESQHEAGVGPEASGNREAVKEKTAMEKELESKVPEEPPTTEGTSGSTEATKGKDAETAAGVGGIAAGGAAAGAYAASGSRGLPASIQQSIDAINKDSLTTTPIAPTVPDVVQESIAESHQSPEAAGSKTMVEEKSAMEKDLLSKVAKEDDVGEPAPSSTAALTETAPTATGSKHLLAKESAAVATGSENLPPKESAPVTTAAAPAQPPAAQNSMKQALQSQPDSRDISPMSKPTNPQQTQPTVTTGVGSSSAPPKSETPAQAAAASTAKPSQVSNSSAATDKKSKRTSFFGKLKSKFSDKDK